MKFKQLIAIFLLVCNATIAIAQEGQKEKRIYQTKRIQNEAPRIDGLIDEKIWGIVDWSGNFTQKQPHDGAKPSQETAFKILYDDDFLYVLIRAYDTEPDKIVERMSRRDGFDGDWVEINIDSYFDQRTAFSFTGSVSGVKGDEAISNDGSNWDSTWDPIWYLKTSIDKEGWIAEMKIPFTQLRFSNHKEFQTWGLQINRRFFRNEERSHWAHFSNDESGYVRHFGELHGIKNIKPKRQAEISPYVVTKKEYFDKEEGNPYREDGTENSLGFGLDGKLGITNDFTLDFTINPDFGQVEADPSEVNLTAFETYFQEKRPFFIENRNITDFRVSLGGPYNRNNLFYSRRIGKAPAYYPDVDSDLGEYTDVPNNTTILGALKLTGKTKNGLSIGIIESLTAEEKAKVMRYNESTNEVNEIEETVEPLTNYFVGRVQKDLNDNNTIIGGMITSTNRFIKDDHLDYLNTDAYTGGIDLTQYFKDKKYALTAKYSMSHIQGDSTAIISQQRSSRRYFQRPDNDYTNYDSSKTSLTGSAGLIQFSKLTNQGFRWGSWLTWHSPEFELNDVGYQQRSDGIFQVIYAGYRWAEPFGIFRNINVGFDQWTNWDFGLNSSFYGFSANTWMQFKNHWSFGSWANIEGEAISNTMLRGGPAIKTPGGWNFGLNLGTDGRKKVQIHGNAGFYSGFDDSQSNHRYGIGLIYRPLDALRISFMPNISYSWNEMQYVDSEEYDGKDRYIFSKINRITTNFTLRIDYSITPNLTIQYYGSPFVSAGDYSDPKYIIDPKANNFQDRYSTDLSWSSYPENGETFQDYLDTEYDFNFRQFRSNLVVRWEYRPGSLLYLVWTQSKTGSESTGDFQMMDDLDALFNIHPQNIFLVKLSFRIAN